MVEFIKTLYSQNKILALTTSAGIEGTTLILKKIGIHDMFKVIISKEDCTKLKPDPEPYLKTAEKLGISPSDCIVIEDSDLGVEAAKRANMKCIAIPNKHTYKQNFSAADLVAGSVEDIKNNILIS
jgi:HAD superfamily hydrolase (TIGR01509 family)